jgi:hypothetical protein
MFGAWKKSLRYWRTKLEKTWKELAKEHGIVTEEIWANPEFREKMYASIFDVGLSVQYDKTQPIDSEGTHTAEHKAQS